MDNLGVLQLIGFNALVFGSLYIIAVIIDFIRMVYSTNRIVKEIYNRIHGE